MNINNAIEEFLLDQQARGNAKKTIRWYQGALSTMARSLKSENLDDITAHDMRNYVASLRTTMSESSVFGYATAAYAFWAWASGEYKIFNPCSNIKRPRRPKPRPRAASAADIVSILKATRDDEYGVRDRALIGFIVDAGARLGGIAGLMIENVYIDEGLALVTEKGNKTRKVHFTKFTARLLYAWLWERARLQTIAPPDGKVFINIETGQGLTDWGISQIFKRLKKRTSVAGRVNPHAFRHHFAREYIRDGGDIATLAKLMGHASIEMTNDYYAIFTESELKEFHEKHTPIKKLEL